MAQAAAPERPGRFIVMEGGDGAGRSTQVRLLLPWLEEQGFATVAAGLGRSEVCRRALAAHQQTPEAGVRTLALLYAADLADQAARTVRPGLGAGFVVVADRWQATVYARCVLRGAPRDWLAAILPAEPRPDLICHLRATPRHRLQREIRKRGLPDFRESGRDLAWDPDVLRGFLRYQEALDAELGRCADEAGPVWSDVPADGDPWEIQAALRRQVGILLGTASAEVAAHG